MDRNHWSRRIAQLDAVDDAPEIYRILFAHEFPWDLNQALSFALYRTYAVPSIGRLLARTGEFTRRTQKRDDDTGLILDTILERGFASASGRTALRRMNPHQTRVERALASGGLTARAAIVRHMPARSAPKYFRHMSSVRSYPQGYAVDQLGTFPAGTAPSATPTAGT